MRRLARLWDEAVELPIVGWRIGLDAVVGLIPGVGDLAGLAAGLYPLGVAARFGAPPSLLGRMGLNLLVDAALGAVPLLGDLFDIAWKANRRNRQLLERWAAEPRRVARGSRAMLVGITVALAGATALAAWGAVWLVVQLIP